MAPTVADLFGDLRRTLDEHGAVADALPHHPGVTRRAADALTGLLDIDLGALVLDGWTQYRELRDAARRSLDRPDEDEEVALVDHRISSTHQPSIELYVGDALVGTVVFDLEVYADLHGVDAVVRAGDLVGVRGGDVDVGARLSSQSRVIAERTASYRTGVLLPLATGVPLVGNPKPAHVARLGSRPLRAAVVGALLVVLLGGGRSAVAHRRRVDARSRGARCRRPGDRVEPAGGPGLRRRAGRDRRARPSRPGGVRRRPVGPAARPAGGGVRARRAPARRVAAGLSVVTRAATTIGWTGRPVRDGVGSCV